MRISFRKSGKLFGADLKIDFKASDCEGDFVITCLVGHFDVQLSKAEFHTCKGKS